MFSKQGLFFAVLFGVLTGIIVQFCPHSDDMFWWMEGMLFLGNIWGHICHHYDEKNKKPHWF